MIVLKSQRIDLARPARSVVHCMQTDNTQQIDVSLFVNNRPYDVTADVANGETVTMVVAYILPNGFGDNYTETALGETAVEQDSSIKHLYHVMIDGACTDIVGFVQIIVKFTTDGGQILNSFPLTLDVIKSQPDDVDPGGGSPATSRYLRKDLQAPATEDMTQPVGVTPDGLLVTAPGEGGGGGSADVTSAAVKSAIEGMSAAQKGDVKTALGYLTAHQNLPNLGGGFGTCASALSTAAKIVQINGFQRVQGVPFAVKFTNGAKNGDTLNVRSSSSSSSGTGAASLYYNGAAIPNGLIGVGAVATLYYDGSNYSVLTVDGVDDGFGICTGNDTNRAVTITGLSVRTGTRISVRFDTYAVPASATLNVNSYGAKAIRKDGAAIAAGVISAGDVATFVYDGTYWQLAGVMPANPASGGDSTTEIIRMSMGGSGPVASKTASEISPLVGDDPSNVVLIDLSGRECALCVKPVPGVFYSPAKFYTLDEANAAIIIYSVADTTGEVTSESISIYSKDPGGIPQTDLAKETVTITAGSGTPVTYSSSKTFSEISTANAAGKLIVPVFNGFEGRCIDVGQNAATFEVIDATIPSAPVQYIFVVSGTGCAGAASNWGSGGGGGAELLEVYITESGGVLSASETVADIVAAYQAGKIVRYINEVGAEGLLFATPTAYGITFVCFDDADGGHPTMMAIYSIAADGTVTASSENILNSLILPGSQTRSAAQMASGLLAVSNAIYTVTGSATGFALTNSTNPITTPGEYIEIRLTTGSTAITTPTWPAWCNLMGGWDGTFAASTYYDIVIDDAGNVYHSTREVSA